MGVARGPVGPVRQAIRLFSRPTAISWQLFVVTGLIWLASGYPTLARAGGILSVSSVAIWCVSVLAGQVALFATLYLGKRTVLRSRFSRRHPGVAVWILLVGVVGGFIGAHTVGSAFGANESFVLIAGEGIPFAVVVVVLVGGVLEAFRVYRQRLQTLQQRASDLHSRREHTVRVLQSDVEAAKQLVLTVQQDARHALTEGGQSGATVLRELSRSLVRPRSHDLASAPMVAEPPTPRVPATRWSQVLEQVSTTPLVAPTFTATLVTLLGFRLSVQAPESTPPAPSAEPVSVSVDWESFGLSILSLVVIFAVTLLSSLVAKQVMRRALVIVSPSVRVTSSVVMVVLVPAVSLLIIALFYRTIGVFSVGLSQPGVVAGFFLVFVAVSAASALFRAVTLASQDVANQCVSLSSQGNRELVRVQQQAWSTRQHLAFALHGPVRTALLATAHALAQSDTPLNEREREKWLDAVDAACAQVTAGEAGVRPPADLRTLDELWRGRCDVSFVVDSDVSPLLADHALLSRVVYQIVDEALANAITHGDARQVEVNLAMSDGLVAMTVESDGEMPESQPTRGLGSELFDQLCVTWSIRSEPGAVRFSALIPITDNR